MKYFYQSNSNNNNNVEIAALDTPNEYLVERVLTHSGDLSKNFEINANSWLNGLDLRSSGTWEPYENIADAKALDDYLIPNNRIW